MKVTVVIPTVKGREGYMERCLRGYRERSGGVELEFAIIPNAPSCGLAWQAGAEKATGDLLHFTADDIVPGEDWLPPMVEAVERGNVPVAGVIACRAEMLDGHDYPLPGKPYLESDLHYFEGEARSVPDWTPADGPSEYPSIPFCSMEQWSRIGPMIAAHYGTDKWFGDRAKRAGFQPVVRHGSVFYHYAALPGRVPKAEGWFHLDRITFDLNVAYPLYESGQLQPHETHPAYGTTEGRKMARDWYAEHVAGVGYWQVNL